MQILLVEPNYKTTYPPLGLMKIATWHKRQGDKVHFWKGNSNCFGHYLEPLLVGYDRIYITSLFTQTIKAVIKTVKYFQNQYPQADIKVGGIAATLLPEDIERETGIRPHIGLLPEIEDCPPDYNLFPSLPYSLTFTSRGCPWHCEYCCVAQHEPVYMLKEWEQDIDLTKGRIVFWDNNWLASSRFAKDVATLQNLNKQFDFNQGLDCRLFDEEKAVLLAKTKIAPLRFSYDSPAVEQDIVKAIKVAQRYKFKDIRVHLLYGSPALWDSPEYFFYRANTLNDLGVLSYPMRYRPINSSALYCESEWPGELLRALKLVLMFYYTKGMISQKREAFIKVFGRTGQEFMACMWGIYHKDKKKR